MRTTQPQPSTPPPAARKPSPRPVRTAPWAVLALVALLAGCVSTTDHDALLKERDVVVKERDALRDAALGANYTIHSQAEAMQSLRTERDANVLEVQRLTHTKDVLERDALRAKQDAAAERADAAAAREALNASYRSVAQAFDHGNLIKKWMLAPTDRGFDLRTNATDARQTRAADVFVDARIEELSISCSSHSMLPTLSCNDVVLFDPDVTTLEVDDIAVYEIPTTDGHGCANEGIPVIHRVVRVAPGRDGVTRYTFQGDDNDGVDDCTVPSTMISGRVVAALYGVQGLPSRLT